VVPLVTRLGRHDLKRSNRLILLIGVVLAVVAFVAIIVLFNNSSGTATGPAAPPTELDTVQATVDIPLGTQVRSDMLVVKKVAVGNRAADVIGDPSQIIGQIVRTDVVSGAQMTQSMFATTGLGQNPARLLPAGLRAMAVQLDQVSSVGSLISVGDRVDAVVSWGIGTGQCTASRGFSLAPASPAPAAAAPVAPAPVAGLGLNSTKLLLQNMQVVGTLLPPPPATTPTGAATPAPTSGGTALTGGSEMVILAVSAQQSEVIKFAQLDGCISLILRSPKDFVDAAGKPVEPPADKTTGAIFKTLVDTYGVLPPQLVEAILPKK
jgi:pilus assembly protein CpaB